MHGLNIDYIQGFGAERDIKIGKSRILLNIHLQKEWKIYESLRCERWRFAGMPIVSETCFSYSPEDIDTYDYDDIVKGVLLKLKNILEKL